MVRGIGDGLVVALVLAVVVVIRTDVEDIP
jgi:hypothetical protein